ncbi:MAG: NAD-dependent deacetylase [Gammaproteobacteria bacterium]|jgi:NAD-dependent SIR2 family protein deacetylase|nr:NAD-dependent deacetylase [Gammaproteobacteria bacterium]
MSAGRGASDPMSTHPRRAQPLGEFIERHSSLFVLTGAGCSTDSGIPDYRDENGDWKRARPVMFQAFVGDLDTRRRYWARSLVGWRRFGHAHPNDAHRALARLEQQGRTEVLVTQNVDGLHQSAGSTGVIDLHGRLDQVRCLGCERRSDRERLQRRLLELNPDWARLDARTAPDGDADLEGLDFSGFEIPACEDCGGLLKPDVVFFGESVPGERVAAALAAMQRAQAMLVIGSSLMVYSGYRFAQAASKAGKPIAAVNLGRTRADALLALKVNQPCVAALAFLLDGAAS